MADFNAAPPAQGDEADLFRRFNQALVRMVGGAVTTSASDTLEDACAYAWQQFMLHQPSRCGNWRAWLFVVAEREAWAIERKLRRETPRGDEASLRSWAKNLAGENPIDVFDDVNEALSMIAPLPERLRGIALLRAFGIDRDGIADITGNSVLRVDHLIRNSNFLMSETLAERAHGEGSLSPRAERLWQLEHDSPDWLVGVIGAPPRGRRRGNQVAALREWRRAAIALDDLRTVAGDEAFRAMDAAPPSDPEWRRLHAAAARSVSALAPLRDRWMGR